MKKLFFAFSIVLVSLSFQTAHSQYFFSIKDMQSMSKLTAEEFDAFVVSKKYNLQPETSTKNVKMYAPEQKRAAGNFELSWTKSKKQSAIISFTTPNGGWYHKIQSIVKGGTEGWSLVKEKKKKVNDVPTVFYHYENQQSHVVLSETSQLGSTVKEYTVECYAIN